MKKITVLLFFFVVTSISVFAQTDCKMCGDWIGSWQEIYPYDFESEDDGDWRLGKVTRYIRIRKYGDEYKIRIKSSYVDIGRTVYDEDEFDILNVTDTSIYWKAISAIDVHYDQNNRIKYYDQTIIYYIITYRNGYIHFQMTDSYYLEYDNNKRLVSTTDFINDQKDKPRYNLDLFKEDNDW